MSRRDDAALYDVGSQEQEAQKDDPRYDGINKFCSVIKHYNGIKEIKQ